MGAVPPTPGSRAVAERQLCQEVLLFKVTKLELQRPPTQMHQTPQKSHSHSSKAGSSASFAMSFTAAATAAARAAAWAEALRLGAALWEARKTARAKAGCCRCGGGG